MYCTLQQIIDELTTAVATELSSDGTTLVMNTTLISNYIDSASDLIDGYLRNRYTLPLANASKILQNICQSIVRYELAERRGNKVYEVEDKAYNRAIQQLTDIQQGKITLDETNTPAYFVVSSRDAVFTDTMLENYNDII